MPRMTLPDRLLFVLAYVLWLASIVACIVAVVEFRSAINVLWVTTGRSQWTLGLAEQISVPVGGLIAFVYVLFLESYYRRSIVSQSSGPKTDDSRPPQGQVWERPADQRPRVLLRRFAWTVAIPTGLLVASLVTREAALRGLF